MQESMFREVTCIGEMQSYTGIRKVRHLLMPVHRPNSLQWTRSCRLLLSKANAYPANFEWQHSILFDGLRYAECLDFGLTEFRMQIMDEGEGNDNS